MNEISSNNIQLSCLYTKQKTQKRKTWKDGRIVIRVTSSRISLHDANPPPGSGDSPLDEIELTKNQLEAVISMTETELETERYLVTVEGPWRGRATNKTPQAAAANRVVSKGMQKVLSRKFRKPSAYVPPHPEEKKRKLEEERRKIVRKKPLQPGELEKKIYGQHDATIPSQLSNSSHDQRQPYSTSQFQHPNQPTQPMVRWNQQPDISRNNPSSNHGLQTSQQTNYHRPDCSDVFQNSRDFNPSNFYGEDEEDEDTDDDEGETKICHQNPQQNHQFRVSNPLSHNQSTSHETYLNNQHKNHENRLHQIHNQYSQQAPQFNQQTPWNHFQPQQNSDNRQADANKSVEHSNQTSLSCRDEQQAIQNSTDAENDNILSKNDLLQLFGAKPTMNNDNTSSNNSSQPKNCNSLQRENNDTLPNPQRIHHPLINKEPSGNSFLDNLLQAEAKVGHQSEEQDTPSILVSDSNNNFEESDGDDNENHFETNTANDQNPTLLLKDDTPQRESVASNVSFQFVLPSASESSSDSDEE